MGILLDALPGNSPSQPNKPHVGVLLHEIPDALGSSTLTHMLELVHLVTHDEIRFVAI